MAYNISFMDNVTGMADFGSELNTLSGGNAGLWIIISMYIAIFSMMKSRGYDTIVSFTVTSFINSVISGLLMFMGWLSWYYALIPFVLFIVSAAMYYFQD